MASLKKFITPSSPSEQRLLETLLFLLRLLIILTPAYLVVSALDLTGVQAAVASQASWLLGLAGVEVSRVGYSLFIGGEQPYSFFISPDSTGWKPLVVLFSLILATGRVDLQKKLIGLAAGLPLLWLANLLRVATIVLIEQAYGVAAAQAAHDVYWPIGLVAILFVVWFAWFWWARRHTSHRP